MTTKQKQGIVNTIIIKNVPDKKKRRRKAVRRKPTQKETNPPSVDRFDTRPRGVRGSSVPSLVLPLSRPSFYTTTNITPQRDYASTQSNLLTGIQNDIKQTNTLLRSAIAKGDSMVQPISTIEYGEKPLLSASAFETPSKPDKPPKPTSTIMSKVRSVFSSSKKPDKLTDEAQKEDSIRMPENPAISTQAQGIGALPKSGTERVEPGAKKTIEEEAMDEYIRTIRGYVSNNDIDGLKKFSNDLGMQVHASKYVEPLANKMMQEGDKRFDAFFQRYMTEAGGGGGRSLNFDDVISET